MEGERFVERVGGGCGGMGVRNVFCSWGRSRELGRLR